MDSVKLFEVFDMFGNAKMGTNYESCIEFEYLDSMAAAGFKFKVAGQWTPRSKVPAAIEAALSKGVGYRIGKFAPEVDLKAQLKATDPDRKIEIIEPRTPVTSESAVPEAPEVSEAPEPITAEPEPAEIQYTKQVRCIDTGKVYPNQSAAARDLHIDPAQVSDSIKTGRPRSGYRFEKVKVGEIL